MNAALQGLIVEGGLLPEDHMRDRRWQRAKLRYDIANKQQSRVRSRDQLRAEREQAWDEAHLSSNSNQATAAFQNVTDCVVCASRMTPQSDALSGSEATRYVTWWEKPNGLVTDHALVPRTPLRPVRLWKDKPEPTGSSSLRFIVRNFRRAMLASEAHRQAWETRYRTETAVRRKHGLGQDLQFDPDFWDTPISCYASRQNYRYLKDEERMQARRARGGQARPRPPRSSLSYSAHTDEVEIDEETLEQMERREEMEQLERMAKKVGEEVGYLYFVGDTDGSFLWRNEYLRSDRQLVYRKEAPETQAEEPQSGSAEAGSESDDDTSDEDDEELEEEDDDDEGPEEEYEMEKNYDEMEIDG